MRALTRNLDMLYFIAAAFAAVALSAGGNGRTVQVGEADTSPEPIAHRETVEPAGVGACEPQRTSPPGALSRVWTDETDPFRRCAAKALAGEFGTLRPWQRDAYRHGLDTGVVCTGVAKVTSYGPWEGCTKWVASGGYVHLAGCAANPELSFGTLIWTPYGLRYVNDRGGWVKVGYARVYGKMKRVTNRREIANIDYYTLSEWATVRNAPFAVVKQTGDRTVWHRSKPAPETPKQ
jgi:hypothetical protein